MASLNLGVVEIPYTDSKEAITTGALAEILERRYHVFSLFYERHKQDIADFMAESMAEAMETAMTTGRIQDDPLAGAMSNIKNLFTKFLSEGRPTEFEGMTYGDLFYPVPTQAALDGISHRFKKIKGGGKRKIRDKKKWGVRRPSLIDTAQFETSFIAWFEEN